MVSLSNFLECFALGLQRSIWFVFLMRQNWRINCVIYLRLNLSDKICDVYRFGETIDYITNKIQVSCFRLWCITSLKCPTLHHLYRLYRELPLGYSTRYDLQIDAVKLRCANRLILFSCLSESMLALEKLLCSNAGFRMVPCCS